MYSIFFCEHISCCIKKTFGLILLLLLNYLMIKRCFPSYKRMKVYIMHKAFKSPINDFLVIIFLVVSFYCLIEGEDICWCASTTWQSYSDRCGSSLQLGTRSESTTRGWICIFWGLSTHFSSRMWSWRTRHCGMDPRRKHTRHCVLSGNHQVKHSEILITKRFDRKLNLIPHH